MPLYKGLLISSQRGREHSASSEIHFTLTNKLGIDRSKIKVRQTGVSGLITAGLDDDLDYHQIVRDLMAMEEETPFFIHCLKIRPIDKVITAEIADFVEIIKDEDIPDEVPYRITVNKRHTDLSSMDIISPIADIIDKDVDLENPKWELWIEIVADQLGYSIIEPELVFSTDVAYETEDEDITNWFLD